MQLLCTSDSVAFIQSLRIALEGEDIAIHCADMMLSPTGFLGPIAGSGGRIYVLNEDDWPRAVEIFRELSGAPATVPPEKTAVPSAGRSSASMWIMLAAAVATVALVVLLLD